MIPACMSVSDMPFNKDKTVTGFKQTREREHFDRLVESMGDLWWGSITGAGIKRIKRRAHLIIKALEKFRDPEILEIGCGTAGFTQYVLEYMPSLRLVGCDISPKAIEVARERCRKYPNAGFEVGDAAAFTYPDNSFDAVIGNAVLHHLPVEDSLREYFRLLRPGGIIWFAEPNMMNPQVAIEKNIRFIGKMMQNTEDETAFFRWPLSRLIRKIGFDWISVEPFDFLHPIVPRPLIKMVECAGKLIERVPVLREISGSLIIRARKKKQP
jgi:ubiquinone/menaquinone biosynthesis C-methylase UbiE